MNRMPSRLLQPLATGFLAVCVCACTGPVYQDRYAWNKGWRKGTVSDPLVSGNSITARLDCRKALPDAAKESRSFARVEYLRGKSYRSIIALAPEGEALHAGQPVYVDPADCSQELVVPR